MIVHLKMYAQLYVFVCVPLCLTGSSHFSAWGGACVRGYVPMLCVIFTDTFCTPLPISLAKLTKTATLKPWFVSSFPNASISVDFPAPGGPDNPILSVGLRVPSCCCLLRWESTFVNNHCACLCFTGCLLSTANTKWFRGQS